MQGEIGMKTIRTTLCVCAVAALSACASLPESLVASPRIELVNIQVAGLGFKSQTFLLSFKVDNPNPFALPVTRIGYGIKLDGQRFASGETMSNLRIPGNGSGEFAISVDVDLLTTAPQLLAIVRDGARRDIAYDLEGRLGVDLPLAPELKYRSSGAVRLAESATSYLLQ